MYQPTCLPARSAQDSGTKRHNRTEVVWREMPDVKSNFPEVLQYISQLASGVGLYQRHDFYAIGSGFNAVTSGPVYPSLGEALPRKMPFTRIV